MTYHRTSEHTSKSLKPGFTALYCGSFCWMLLHCFQIAHSLVLLPRSPHIRLIRSASLACLNKGWKTAFRSSYLSLARSLRITHAIRDPKIPILPTGTRRVCNVLTLFLDTLPGTSRNGVPATTNQYPPTNQRHHLHRGRDHYFWDTLKKPHYFLCSKQRGNERDSPQCHLAIHQWRELLAAQERAMWAQKHRLSEGMVLLCGSGNSLRAPIFGDQIQGYFLVRRNPDLLCPCGTLWILLDVSCFAYVCLFVCVCV